jgi:hypothetical protein
MPDGRYAVLNREYKPLGFLVQDWVAYENFPILARFKITPMHAKYLSHNGSTNRNLIYLYDDGSIPTDSPKKMERYLKRLKSLAKLSTGYE